MVTATLTRQGQQHAVEIVNIRRFANGARDEYTVRALAGLPFKQLARVEKLNGSRAWVDADWTVADRDELSNPRLIVETGEVAHA